MFYEWDELDAVDYIKKIPLIHVNAKTYLDILTKIIQVDMDFLTSIKEKTKLNKNKNLEYACIFGDGKNSLAVEFDSTGKTISKSSLTLDDELSINEFMYNILESNLNYTVLYNEEKDDCLRQELKIKNILKHEIANIVKTKNYSKLKYLYLEWFMKIDNDYPNMVAKMLSRLDNNLGEKEYAIYEIIKSSYNNV